LIRSIPTSKVLQDVYGNLVNPNSTKRSRFFNNLIHCFNDGESGDIFKRRWLGDADCYLFDHVTLFVALPFYCGYSSGLQKLVILKKRLGFGGVKLGSLAL